MVPRRLGVRLPATSAPPGGTTKKIELATTRRPPSFLATCRHRQSLHRHLEGLHGVLHETLLNLETLFCFKNAENHVVGEHLDDLDVLLHEMLLIPVLGDYFDVLLHEMLTTPIVGDNLDDQTALGISWITCTMFSMISGTRMATVCYRRSAQAGHDLWHRVGHHVLRKRRWNDRDVTRRDELHRSTFVVA